MKYIFINIVTLLICTTALNVNGQVTKKLQSAYLDFDYTKFDKEYQQEDAPTIDEQHLWVEISYKLRKFDACLSTIQNLKAIEKVTAYELAIEKNIQDHLKFNAGKKSFDFKPIDNNSDKLDFSCLVLDSMLLFSSNRGGNLMVKKVDVRDEMPFLNMYRANVVQDSTSKTKLITPTIHKYNEGPITKFENGYLLTRNYDPKKGQNNLKMVYLDSSFNELNDFEFNNEAHSVGHATISKDGKTLVFASDMPTGNGITDLFLCRREGGKWTEPERLGANINSPGNEMFPLLQGDKLYFSSNGHGGNGELDIFVVDLNSAVNIPLLLPYPINSKYDDFGFVSEDGGVSGYLTSDRDQNSMDDIYYFDRSTVTFGCDRECENEPCVQFEVDQFDQYPHDRFEFRWDFGDENTDVGPYVYHCYNNVGNYSISLSLYDKLEKKLRENVMSETVDVNSISKSLPVFTIPNEIEINEEITLVDASIIDNGGTTESFWNLGNGSFSEDESPLVSFDSPGYKKITRNVKVQNGDDCCYEAYYDYIYVKPSSQTALPNQSLGNLFEQPDQDTSYLVKILVVDELGNNIKDFDYAILQDENLIIKNTSSDTISYELAKDKNYTFEGTSSYGNLPVQLITTNNKTEEQFTFYRFVISKPKGPQYIVRAIDTKNQIISSAFVISGLDTIGKTNSAGLFNLPEKPSAPVFVGKKFYFGTTIAAKDFVADTPKDAVLSKIEANAVIRLENIYFDLSKWNIRPDAAIELDKVVALMEEYPSMVIELRAHTDARGSSSSNMTLSDKRAKSSAAYIVSKGIDINRIKGQGYGETLILNECVDGIRCSEEKHQWNRRVEVAILSM